MMRYETICKREVFGNTELYVLQFVNADVDLPYHAQIWGASRWLATALGSLDLKGLRILEIGCGLAVPSLLAAKNGAVCTAIDMHDDCEEFLIENAKRNGLDRRIKFIQSDWRDFDHSSHEFDLVIASDVLYEAGHADSLAQIYADILNDTNSGIVIDPCRNHLDRFLSELKAHDLHFDRINQFVSGRKFADLRIRRHAADD